MARYECEICRCRLDPGEGRICSECMDQEEQKSRYVKAVESSLKVGERGQYHFKLGGITH